MRKIIVDRLSVLARKVKSLSEIIALGKKSGVRRYSDCFITINKFLPLHKPEILFDIGAHTGSWSYVMSEMSPSLHTVVLFEPQKANIEILCKSSYLAGFNKKVYPVALGSKEDAGKIMGGTASASLLEVSDDEARDFLHGNMLNVTELAKVRRLDDIVKEDDLPIPDTIKIDVQGYELEVLKGAVSTLEKAKFLIIELSFTEIYKGQPRLHEIIGFLDGLEFKFVEYGYEWRHKGEIVQLDAIFKNAKP